MATGWQPAFRATGIVGPVAMLGLSTQWAHDGKIAPADPVREVTSAFVARLNERGIAATLGGPAVAPPPVSGQPAGAELASVRSAPVTDLMGLALELSDNTLTESLARQAAFLAGRSSDFEGTAAYLRDALAIAGVDATGVVLHDASGLSRTNAVPARVLADVLQVAVLEGSPPSQRPFGICRSRPSPAPWPSGSRRPPRAAALESCGPRPALSTGSTPWPGPSSPQTAGC